MSAQQRVLEEEEEEEGQSLSVMELDGVLKLDDASRSNAAESQPAPPSPRREGLGEPSLQRCGWATWGMGLFLMLSERARKCRKEGKASERERGVIFFLPF